MELINDLRHLYRNFQKKRKPNQTIAAQWQEGVPKGLEYETLSMVWKDSFGEKLGTVKYQHLSGWKTSGAYRLMIVNPAGRMFRLIYKDSIYSYDQIPALVNLPIKPGLPEYAIYSQSAGALSPYLPAVYWVEEKERGTHYRYFLEDLSENFYRAYTYEDIQACASLLPRFHQAFRSWAGSARTEDLLHYGRQLSLALQSYVYANLESFDQVSDNPALKTILKNWSEISRLHAQPEFFMMQAELPIHGDTNYTNIHISKKDPQQIKLVDWEWAGFGQPYADLASLLKGTPSYVERSAYQHFTGRDDSSNPCLNPDLTDTDKKRLYRWCQLERGLLDSGFLAAQMINHDHTPNFSLPQAISHALARVLSAYQKLTD